MASDFTPEAYVELTARVERFAPRLEAAIGDAGLAVRVPVVGTLAGLFFGDELPVDYASAQTTNEKVYAALFHEMLDRGVALAPGAYEVLFVGMAHTDEVLDEVLDVAADAAAAVAAHLG